MRTINEIESAEVTNSCNAASPRSMRELTLDELEKVSGGGTVVEIVAVVGTAVAAGLVVNYVDPHLAGTIKDVASKYN